MLSNRTTSFGSLALLVSLLAGSLLPAQRPGEGTEIEWGGEGKGQGKFLVLQDIAFDSGNRLYVLDGLGAPGKNGQAGNGLVQKFDNAGRFLGQFSIVDPKLGNKNGPARLAVTSQGHVIVTVPRAGLVQQYSNDGKLLRSTALKGRMR